MALNSEEILNSLVVNVSKMTEVQSIGISGNKFPLPKKGEGDIDIFIYCDQIPDYKKREAIIEQMAGLLQECKINVFEGENWGVGDLVLIDGVETWLMYFTISETLTNVESILQGDYPDKIDNYYYPIGRCAMFKNITILYDKDNFLLSLKNRLIEYPNELAKSLVQFHLNQLEDTEDLERAVQRKDIMFYHFALDIAIDHFLQVLFALNKTYFPSRKRTLTYIKNFKTKPENCNEKLLEVIKLGSSSEGINQSYELWSNLINELKNKSF